MSNVFHEDCSEQIQQDMDRLQNLQEQTEGLINKTEEADCIVYEDALFAQGEPAGTSLTGDLAVDMRNEHARRCVEEISDMIHQQEHSRPRVSASEPAKAAVPDSSDDDLDDYSSGDDSDLEDLADSEECDPGTINWNFVRAGEDGYGVYGPCERVENEWDYLRGGHHPVRITDRFDGPMGQYRVINKLGSGGYGNVWLCRVRHRRPTEYVALKILVARDSGEDGRELSNVRRLQELAKTVPEIEKYCLLPLDEFRFEGPNGIHQCFVYPVAGSQVEEIWNIVAEPREYLRSLSRQAVEAMALLHRNGICHGDFRPANILLRLDGLNGLPEKQVNKGLGLDTTRIVRFEGFDESSNPPPYLVKAAYLDHEFHSAFATGDICVVDFGECFETSNPPDRGAIPFAYASPELALGEASTPASDIWALAATIFEIRFGRDLFKVEAIRFRMDDEIHVIGSDAKPSYIFSMVRQCGRFTEPLWSQWSEHWITLQQIFDNSLEDDESTVDGAALRRDTIQSRVNGIIAHVINPGDKTQGWRTAVDTEEKELFEDLLFKMTEGDPAKRLSIEEVLRHPWCSYTGGKSAVAQDDIPVNASESPVIGSPGSAQADKPQTDMANGPEMEDISMLDAQEKGDPAVDVHPGQPSQSTTPQSAKFKLPSPAEESKPLSESSGSQLQLNVVQYGVLAVSTWIRTTVGRAFRSVAR